MGDVMVDIHCDLLKIVFAENGALYKLGSYGPGLHTIAKISVKIRFWLKLWVLAKILLRRCCWWEGERFPQQIKSKSFLFHQVLLLLSKKRAFFLLSFWNQIHFEKTPLFRVSSFY